METQEIAKKQLETVNKILTGLRPLITKKDRKDWVSKEKTTRETLSAYLNGRAVDLDTAQEMITFFKGKVEARKAFLETA